MTKQVDLWVGRFANRGAFSTYFSEEFDEEADERPISQFAADVGQPFYDHDAIEMAFHSRARSLGDMLAPHSGATSFVEAAQTAFDQRDWSRTAGRINTIILAYDAAIDRPVTIERPGYWLVYLGRFNCDLMAGANDGDVGPPTGITLTIVQGGPVLWRGAQVSAVPVDARGLIIGAAAGAPDDPPCLDLSAVVPGLAARQLRIARDQFDQWQIEELAGTDLVRFRGQVFSRGRAFPWHGQRIVIGPVELEWTVE